MSLLSVGMALLVVAMTKKVDICLESREEMRVVDSENKRWGKGASIECDEMEP